MITSVSFVGGADLTLIPGGPPGPTGPVPDHAWTGTSLKFRLPDGSWGAPVDLKGAKGDKGDTGARTEMRIEDGVLQWRLAAQTPADSWKTLINLDTYLEAADAAQEAAESAATSAATSEAAAAISATATHGWRDEAATLANVAAIQAGKAASSALAIAVAVGAYRPDPLDLLPIPPIIDLDLSAPRAIRSAWLTRASNAAYTDQNGVVRTAASGELRIDHDPVSRALRGALLESATTNLLTSPATPSSQDVAVSAATYTLSFQGTGTVTLSGAWVGALAGTGASERVSLTFTAGAGTLHLDVSGSVVNAQLEAAPAPTSYTATTRAADALTIPNSDTWDNRVSVFLECTLPALPQAGQHGLFRFEGSAGNRFGVYLDGATGKLVAQCRSGGGSDDSSASGVISGGALIRIAARFVVDDFGFCVNGADALTDIGGAVPVTSNFDLAIFDNRAPVLVVRRAIVVPGALDNATLKALSTL